MISNGDTIKQLLVTLSLQTEYARILYQTAKEHDGVLVDPNDMTGILIGSGVSAILETIVLDKKGDDQMDEFHTVLTEYLCNSMVDLMNLQIEEQDELRREDLREKKCVEMVRYIKMLFD